MSVLLQKQKVVFIKSMFNLFSIQKTKFKITIKIPLKSSLLFDLGDIALETIKKKQDY